VNKKTYFDYFDGKAAESPQGQEKVGGPAPKAEAPGADLRQSQRIPIEMRVKVQNKESVEESAITRNVSNRGICFVSSKPFKVDEEVRVELYLEHNRHVGPLPGRILWAAPEAKTWRHGVLWSKKVNLGLGTAPPTTGPKPPAGGNAS
jgi:Tfp pilus assembly protein PilZ